MEPRQLRYFLTVAKALLMHTWLQGSHAALRERGRTLIERDPDQLVWVLSDGRYGYRVVRPDWEAILTALRRGECNALAVVDIDQATRDRRVLEDLIDAVELYGVYVVSMTGNIDLSTAAGISAARNLVNQRNAESRNTSRRVIDGKRRAAGAGKNHGGPNRAFGWRKDRLTLNKRESAHIRKALPRILAGVSPLTLARAWNDRGIPVR